MRDSYVLDTMLSPSYILTSLVCTSTHCSGVYCYLHFTGKETEAQSCQGSWPRCSSLLVSGRAGTCTQAVWFHSCSPVLIILMCYLRTALDQSWGPRVPVFDVTPAVSSSAKNLVSYKLWSPEQCACCHRAIVRPPSLLAHHDDTFLALFLLCMSSILFHWGVEQSGIIPSFYVWGTGDSYEVNWMCRAPSQWVIELWQEVVSPGSVIISLSATKWSTAAACRFPPDQVSDLWGPRVLEEPNAGLSTWRQLLHFFIEI